MDDFVFLSYEDYAGTAQLIKLMLRVFSDFGIAVNHEKSVLTP